MGLPQNPSPPHFYPQALQLKLYQAFIFSIPILFSIILFLLFYLFYLKRRASTVSSSQATLPTTLNQDASLVRSPCEMGLKGDLKDLLPIILFDEDLRARDSLCCVCLGEFELKEELHQVPSCKHVFHVDCIHHWLHSNSTCPLCRCPVIPSCTAKLAIPQPPLGQNSHRLAQIIISSEQQRQEEEVHVRLNISNLTGEEQTIQNEGSSSVMSTTCLSEPGRRNELGNPVQESVVLHLQTHNS